MTTRPKLYPHHRHEWEATLIDNEVRCLVCGWELPEPIAAYDNPSVTERICGATATTKTRGTITCAQPAGHPGPHFTKAQPAPEKVPVHDSGVAT
jgi:hypothetical protein